MTKKRSEQIPLSSALWLPLLLLVTAALGLSACREQQPAVTGVSVHGVNYRADPFFYLVTSVETPDVGGAAETIDPFSGGGITCCVSLPNKWRAGTKLLVRTTTWKKKLPDGSLPEVREKHIVDVPEYANGKPGELWVIREPDGKISVVSSDFQPDHPKWPGKLKGWPIPSIEYQRERWQLHVNIAEGYVGTFRSLSNDLKKDPIKRAKDAWDFAKVYSEDEIAGFSGPDDPRYIEYLRRDYAKSLAESEEELKRLMEMRP